MSFIESGKHIPFEIKRVYYLYDVPGGETRAGHALKKTEQFIIAASGSFDLILDDGKERTTIALNRSWKGVLYPNDDMARARQLFLCRGVPRSCINLLRSERIYPGLSGIPERGENKSAMNVLFSDVKSVNDTVASELDGAFQRVLRSGRFILGQEVESFEAEFAAYCKVQYCIGVASGMDALQLSLLACGIGSGDEVITVSHTFTPTAFAIAAAGAIPVFVDIDPQTYTLRPDQLESAISERTRAILPVHLYGHCADMDAILEIAARHQIDVIEDAAQAHGSRYKGRRAGSMGRLGCLVSTRPRTWALLAIAAP